MKTKNKMGLLSIILLGVNAIIGSGNLFTSQQGIFPCWNVQFIRFSFDAVLVITIALCFAEAAGLFKENGGPYVYAKKPLVTLSVLKSALSNGSLV